MELRLARIAANKPRHELVEFFVLVPQDLNTPRIVDRLVNSMTIVDTESAATITADRQ